MQLLKGHGRVACLVDLSISWDCAQVERAGGRATRQRS
jgi:hypothetical protein